MIWPWVSRRKLRHLVEREMREMRDSEAAWTKALRHSEAQVLEARRVATTLARRLDEMDDLCRRQQDALIAIEQAKESKR